MNTQMTKRLALCAALASLGAACSEAPEAKPDDREEPRKEAVAAPVPAQAVANSTALAKQSAVTGKRDIMQDGKPACFIDFSYEGYVPETLIWEGEKCDTIQVKLINPDELGKLGKWERLDDFAQKHVRTLTQGEVLYVEGKFTASVFPVGTTGQSYEVVIAD